LHKIKLIFIINLKKVLLVTHTHFLNFVQDRTADI
jgi:hypothetical protein